MAFSIGFDIFARDRASDTFDELGNRVENARTRFDHFSKVAAVGVAVVGAAVVKFGTDSLAAYTEAEASQRVLTDAYGRFPALADVSIESLRDLAAAQQEKTKFDGDEVAASMGTLAQYKLTGKQLQDLTPLMLDYAQKTGKSLPEAAIVMGKAVQGSGKALKDVGIKFTDLKDPTKNLDQLMGGLRKQVGGFAEKEGKSAEGQSALLKNKFGDLQEEAGSRLQPALLKVTDVLIKVVDWLGKNETTVKNVAIGVGVLAVAFGVANVAVAAHGAALTITAAGGLRSFLMGSRLVTAGQWLMNAALSANPIGLVVVAIALLVGGLILAYKNSETFRKIVDTAFKAIGAAGTWLWNNALQPMIQFILGGFANVARAIGGVLIQLGNIPGFGWAKTAGEKMLDAADGADKLAAGVKKIPEAKTVTVTVKRAGTSNDQLSSLEGYMSRLKSKNVTLTVTQQGGLNKRAGMLAGMATGGPTQAGRAYIVGEDGPEIWSETSDGFVTNAADTARALAGRGGGAAAVGGDQNVTVQFVLDGRVVQQSLLRLKRTGGAQLGLA